MQPQDDSDANYSLAPGELRRMVRDIHDKVATIHRIVTGDSEPERGHVVRIDRLEQEASRREKLEWLIISALVILFVGSVWNWLRESGGGPAEPAHVTQPQPRSSPRKLGPTQPSSMLSAKPQEPAT